MGRLDVPHDKYPGIDFEYEHFFGKEVKIHTRKVVKMKGYNHIHDFPQMYYCHKGKMQHCIDGRYFELSGGDMLIIPPGAIHSFVVLEAGDIINFNVSFEIPLRKTNPLSVNAIAYMFLARFWGEEFGFSNVTRLEKSSVKIVYDAFCRLMHLEKEKKRDYCAIIGAVNEIFSLAEFALDEAKQKSAESIIADRLLPSLRAVVYMNNNFSKKIHCEDLLRVSGLCRTDFYRAIKKTVGDTYSIYLQKIRVQRAHRALGFSDYSFSYISDMCGFGSPTYFGKCYKKYRGYTPKEERAALEELLRNYPAIRVTHDFFEAEYMGDKRNGKK